MRLGWMSAAVVAASLYTTTALAEDVFDASGMVEFLPVGQLMGDGASPSQLFLLALDGSGQPMTELDPALTVKGASNDGWSELGNGLYQLLVTPDRTSVASQVVVQFKVKTPGKPARRNLTIDVLPWTSASLALSASPDALTIGDKATSSITLQLGDAAGADPSQLVFRVSSGAIDNLTPLGDGKIVARYTAPEAETPELALITVSDRRQPNRVYGALRIPLSVEVEQEVEAEPESTVILKVAGREFGPMTVPANGKVLVPLLAAPGPGMGELVTVTEGGSTEVELDLGLPEKRHLQILPPPTGIPGDSAIVTPLRAVVYTPDGEPETQAEVIFEVSAGTVSEPRHEGAGIYVVDFTPADTNEAAPIVFTVRLGDSEVQIDTVELPISPARPHAVELSATPASFGEAKEVALAVSVKGPNGLPLSGRSIDLNITGGRTGELLDAGDGTYSAPLKTYAGAVEIIGTVQTPGPGNPLERLAVVAHSQRVNTDGVSSVMVNVVALDQYGYPVPNVDVALNLESGSGQFPTQVTTDAGGVGQIFYTAGRQPGLVAIRATALGHQATTALLELPPAAAQVTLPNPGGAELAELEKAWKGLVGTLRVEK